MDKRRIREFYINHWFSKREIKARAEVRGALDNSKERNSIILYRGLMMNPLQISASSLSGVYEVPEDSEHGRALDRLVRVQEERTKAEGFLVKILNHCDNNTQFEYIVFGDKKELITNLEEMDYLKEQLSDKLSFLKRMRLMADMVK